MGQNYTTGREAYDLHNKYCRKYVWSRVKVGAVEMLVFLKLVWTDTVNNVCPQNKI